jgi:hypothetical protein
MTAKVSIHNISFPIFRLGITPPTTEGGVTFFLLGKDTEYSDAEYKILIIDDKNRPEPSLALRRLAMKNEGTTLYNLKQAIFFISDLVKLAKGNTWFIDKEGQIFNYQKTERVRLVYKRISKITNMSSGGAIIEVEGVSSRFKTLHRPSAEQVVAGLLLVHNSYILYGLYDKIYDSSTRMI